MVKFFKYLIFIILITVSPLYAANYYFDLASGSDVGGDGSAGNPWKTIDKCTTSRSVGDECRGAKTVITTLAGTLTFTNGSTSVTTSSDQTAVVAAGDLVGKNTGVDTWWVVASVSAGAITLSNQYWAPTGSGSAVTGYKITPVAASEKYDINSSGSAAAYLKISGGWDLTGPTQDGWTCFSAYSTGAGIALGGDSYVELSRFIVYSSGNYPIDISTSNYAYLHDLHLSGNGTTYTSFYLNSSYGIAKDIYVNSIQTSGAIVSGVLNTLENIYVYSSGNGASEYGISVTGYCNAFKNVRSYNSYDDNLNISSDGGFNLFTDCIFDTNRSANSYSVNIIGTQPENRFYNCTLTGATSSDINMAAATNTNYFINCTLSGSTGDYVALSTISESATVPGLVIAPSGSGAYRVFVRGIITSDTADARSGLCVKIAPTGGDTPIGEKVGSVKVPSAGSDLTVSIYLKDDADFNGTVWFVALQNGQWLSRTAKVPTTSYVKESVVIPAASLIASAYIDLWVFATGTAGAAYVDDFSAEQ